MATDGLSDREKQVLEHLERAQSLGVSVKEYCEAYSLDAKDLYNGKAQLVRKGVLSAKAERASFLPVEVSPAPAPAPVGFRLTHQSGWTIECSVVPDAAWIQALLRPAA